MEVVTYIIYNVLLSSYYLNGKVSMCVYMHA